MQISKILNFFKLEFEVFPLRMSMKMIEKIIAGVDEAGRGALAGPVVAAAVILHMPNKKRIFFDSKQTTQKKRREQYNHLIKNYDYGIGVISAKEIDEIGIKKATNKAMQQAVQKLKTKPTVLYVDGRDKFQFDIFSVDFVRGDDLHECISAASIIAKVTRDELMTQYAKEYSEFQFAENKGYGTAPHLALLEQERYTPIHRRTYDPLSTYLSQMRMF